MIKVPFSPRDNASLKLILDHGRVHSVVSIDLIELSLESWNGGRSLSKNVARVCAKDISFGEWVVLQLAIFESVRDVWVITCKDVTGFFFRFRFTVKLYCSTDEIGLLKKRFVTCVVNSLRILTVFYSVIFFRQSWVNEFCISSSSNQLCTVLGILLWSFISPYAFHACPLLILEGLNISSL